MEKVFIDFLDLPVNSIFYYSNSEDKFIKTGFNFIKNLQTGKESILLCPGGLVLIDNR